MLISRLLQSFIRALRALWHPESDPDPEAQARQSMQCRRPSVPPSEVEYDARGFQKENAPEESETATATSTSGVTSMDRGQVGVTTNAAPNQRASDNDVMCHI